MDEGLMEEPQIEEGDGDRKKKRHGCLTTWLILMLVANAAGAIFYLSRESKIFDTYSSGPDFLTLAPFLLMVVNIICVVGLFEWKKWGFWGSGFSVIAGLVVNSALGVNNISVMSGFLGLFLLYLVLQIGGENKGWDQLE